MTQPASVMTAVRATAPWHHHALPLLALILAILLANAIALTGLYQDNPALFVSNLATGVLHGPVAGIPNWLDPNIGYTTQALGNLSAQDWLHGVPPWWDPYQGVGTPLAAELQNGAFFLPFSLLLHFDAGWLMLRLTKQCMAGCFTYALLIQLRLSRLAALMGGVMFGCSSTFVILADAPSNTLPFLPLLLLGIELGLASDRRFARGWSLVIIAVAYSFYAGFPETGFLADLLGGLWFIVRLTAQERKRWLPGAKRFAIAVGIAFILTLPGLVPFIQYVSAGAIGIHAHDAATAALPLVGLTTQIWPQAFGPIACSLFVPQSWASPALHALNQNWLSDGGWIGLLPLTLAVAGELQPNGGEHRWRWLLLAWVLVWEARIFGLKPAILLLDLVQPIRMIVVERYAEPSVDFAVILLGAMAFDQWLRGGLSRRTIKRVGLTVIAIDLVVLGIGIPAFMAIHRLVPQLTGMVFFYLAITLIAFVTILYSMSQSATTLRSWLVFAIMTLDAMGGFGLSQAAGVSRGHLDLSGVAYLRRHQGLQRAYSLGPLAPNYSSRYRVAEIDTNMLPIPQNWSNFVHQALDPFQSTISFIGADVNPLPRQDGPARMLRDNLANYQSLGVRFILANPHSNPLHTAQKPVFTSKVMWIYRLDHAAPYYAASPQGTCVITAQKRTSALAQCAHGAILIRRELFFSGWHARVNGHAVTVRQAAPLFQQITLPAGRSKIRFFYRPPFERSACAVAALALLLWLALLIYDVRKSISL